MERDHLGKNIGRSYGVTRYCSDAINESLVRASFAMGQFIPYPVNSSDRALRWMCASGWLIT
jgi:hypothetical protein